MTDQAPLSIEEACAAARVCRSTIFNAVKTGKLRVIKAGRRTLIRPDDFKRWLGPSAAPAWQSGAPRRLKRPIVELTKTEMQEELRRAVINTGGTIIT